MHRDSSWLKMFLDHTMRWKLQDGNYKGTGTYKIKLQISDNNGNLVPSSLPTVADYIYIQNAYR